MVNQNILKLQKEGYLSDHLLKVKQMVEIGSSARRAKIIYALTRHQMYHLIMDFFGTQARIKKHSIVIRLESVEVDILKGDYVKAREKACSWDGTQLLKDLGFQYSLPGQMATKQDIIQSMDIPESTLNTFLRRHSDQIKPVRLNKATIQSLGIKANRLNAYAPEDVFKIVFWMDSTMGIQVRKKIFGDIGIEEIPVIRHETEWKSFLSKVFAGV